MTDWAEWETPDPGEVLILAGADDWSRLVARYTELEDEPLQRCLEVARAGGASTVVVETRYIDLDYRSEYSAFYSKTFRSQPDSTHRLHFFKAPLLDEQLWDLPHDHGYLGYIVVRPSSLGLVGRTVLEPPPGRIQAVRTSITEPVTFFGQKLEVSGVPFMEQDTQLGRCAHAAGWMCHYSAFRRGEAPRRAMAEFSLSAEPGLGYGRSLPSEGLTVQQLLELLRVFDVPPAFYDISNLPTDPEQATFARPDPQPPETDEGPLHPGLWDGRIFRICCQYLNSGLPILVGTEDHTFVLCGYERIPRDNGEPDWIRFIRHDDQRGPYLVVDDVFNDVAQDGHVYSPWETIIVPLPDKLWLPPLAAEALGGELLQGFAETTQAEIPEAAEILRLIQNDQLALHTYARPANEFKSGLVGRVDPILLREYRLARFSRYVWVVEAVDRAKRRSGESCVLGEVIFDATSSESDPLALAMHVPGVAWVHRTQDQPRFPIRCAPDPYQSGAVGPP